MQTVFDAAGQVVETIDPMNRATYYVWSENGVTEDDPPQLLKTEAPDPTGGTNFTTTTNVYDAAGRLVEKVDPIGRVTAFQVDAEGRQTGEQDPSAADGTNNQTFNRSTATGPVTSVVYSPSGDAIQQFDAAGNETDNIFDASGHPLSTTGPAPTPGAPRPTTSFTYSPDGEVLTETNALSQTTQFVFNSFGEKVKQIDPSPYGGTAPGPVQTWSYDADGNLVSFTTATGHTYTYKFNNRNERVEEDDPSPDGYTAGPAWKWSYSLAGELTQEVDPMGRVTQWVHDGDGNVIQTIAPNLSTGGAGDASTTTFTTYDLDSEKTSETPPLPAGASGSTTTTFQYDPLGDLVQTSGPAPSPGQAEPVTKYAFNLDQELVSTTDPLGRTQSSTIDGLGRTTSSTSFEGVTTQYGYDVLSNLVTASDSSGTVTNTFDALGRETKTVNQSGGTTQMGFDLLGNMTSLVDPAGNKTTFQFNGLNQETSDANQLGATETYQYNADGQITETVGRDGHIRTFTYNDLGQQTAENWGPGTNAANVWAGTVQWGSGGAEDTIESVSLPSATGGTWTLSLDGKTTAPISWNATASQLQQALYAIVPSGPDVTVYAGGAGTASNPFIVDFGYGLRGTNVDLMTADGSQLIGASASIDVEKGVPGRLGRYSGGEVEFVTTVSGDTISSGSFTLEVNGYDTAPLPYNASGPQVEAALAALPGIGAGNVFVYYGSVTSDWQQQVYWDIYFVGALADTQVTGTLASNTVAGAQGPATPYCALGDGGPGQDTIEHIVVTAAGGTFTITYTEGYDTGTTAPLAYNATAAQVQAAINGLEPLAGTGGAVTVTGTGTPVDPYVVTFVGYFAGRSMKDFTADGSQLIGGVNTITTTYNADGQIASIGDNYSHYGYSYDGQGNVASVDNSGTPGVPDVVLTSQYDAAGNRSSLSAAVAGSKDFLNSYGYNALSQLDSIQQQGRTGGNAVAPKSFYFGLDPIGDITEIDRSNSISAGPNQSGPAYSVLSYNTQGHLTGINHEYMGSSLDDLTYSYDSLGRVSTFGSIDGTASYGYDRTSQLVSATYVAAAGHSEPPNLSTTFDPNGNRSSVNGASTSISTNNEVTNDGTFTYQFDAEGNRTVRTRISTASATDYKTTYSWDYRNRLTDVETFNNSGALTSHVHYVYDVWDHLIERDVDPNGSGSYTQTVHYVWDASAPPTLGDGGQPPSAPGNIVLAFNGNDRLTTRYLNGPNTSAYDQFFTTLAEEDVGNVNAPGTVYYYLLDDQGSLTDEVGSNGALANHITYDAYGQDLAETNPALGHLSGFGGGLYDPLTQLVNNVERWYDPLATTWISFDPRGFAAGDTNPSRYVGNSPANAMDPGGLEVDPVEADVTTQEGEWTWEQFRERQSRLSKSQLELAGNLGCYGLMMANTGIIPREPTGSAVQNPLKVPGMTLFGSYAEAQKYQSNHPGSYIIAYQFLIGERGSYGWNAPSQGQLTLDDLPDEAQNNFNKGNWLTLLRNDSGKWYWQYMNYGSTSPAFMGGAPSMVYNAKFNDKDASGGVPPQEARLTQSCFWFTPRRLAPRHQSRVQPVTTPTGAML